MYKWTMFALIIVAGALGLGILFDQISERESARAAEKTAGPTVKIEATNFKFNQPEYTVKTGEQTKIVFVSKEGAHGIEIVNADIKLDKQTTSKDVKFDKPGKYEILCNIPCGEGHATMKATLVVQ